MRLLPPAKKVVLKCRTFWSVSEMTHNSMDFDEIKTEGRIPFKEENIEFFV